MGQSIRIFHKFLMGVTAFFNGWRVTAQRSCCLHRWERPFRFHNGWCFCHFHRCLGLKWLSVVLISTTLPLVFSVDAWASDESPFSPALILKVQLPGVQPPGVQLPEVPALKVQLPRVQPPGVQLPKFQIAQTVRSIAALTKAWIMITSRKMSSLGHSDRSSSIISTHPLFILIQ